MGCIRFTICVIVGLIFMGVGIAWSEQLYNLTITPEELNIDTFYAGTQVVISGEKPKGQDIIIEISGPVMDSQFDLKKRLGPFWMTRDHADIDGAPAMYVLLLPKGDKWKEEAEALGLGLGKLEKKISLHSITMARDTLFDMFVELKKSEGQYLIEEDAVTYATPENDQERFTANFRFPRSTTKGEYTVKAIAIADGVKLKEQSRPLKVNEVGFVRLIDHLATDQRIIYGIAAVVIALFTGAVMGLLFKGSGSH